MNVFVMNMLLHLCIGIVSCAYSHTRPPTDAHLVSACGRNYHSCRTVDCAKWLGMNLFPLFMQLPIARNGMYAANVSSFPCVLVIMSVI